MWRVVRTPFFFYMSQNSLICFLGIQLSSTVIGILMMKYYQECIYIYFFFFNQTMVLFLSLLSLVYYLLWFKVNDNQDNRQTFAPILKIGRSTPTSIQLTAHNWQKWTRVFPTCPCHEIYRDEAAGLKSCKYRPTWKITIFVKMWNLGQYRENLIFCQ